MKFLVRKDGRPRQDNRLSELPDLDENQLSQYYEFGPALQTNQAYRIEHKDGKDIYYFNSRINGPDK